MPDLPSGTVTFLFTDIEGSTALWERDRAAMRDGGRAAAGHPAQPHRAPTTGSSTRPSAMAPRPPLHRAEDALRAALASQRALLAEDWGESSDRCGCAWRCMPGRPTPDARGDYLAAPLNRLSRLLATGHGGQILLSQTVQQLTRGALPAGSELRDLGEHRLRDLLEPERVFQLLHPDLPAAVPAPQVAGDPAEQPALAAHPFLGREQEVRADRRAPAPARGAPADADGQAAPARPAWPCRPRPSSWTTSPTGSSSCRWPR